MLEDGALAAYTYQGRTFASKEAMELFIASRSPVQLPGAGARPGRRGGVGTVLAIGVVVLVTMCAFGGGRTGVAPPEPERFGASQESKDKLAMLVNVSGQLCARVTEVSRIEGDVYQITCVRSRDGDDLTAYQINAATGVLK